MRITPKHGGTTFLRNIRNVTFTLKRENCPTVTLNGNQIPQVEAAIYLGIYLDRRLTWPTHICAKRKQLGLKFLQTYRILGRRSELSIENKLLIYKTILKPIWTYGIPLWGTASNSNSEILQRHQNKVLRAIVNAPCYISNKVIHAELKVPTVREDMTKFIVKYRDKITTHPNEIASKLLEEEESRRLKRSKTTDLTIRFS
jgi:hypothetical protein